MQKTDFQRTGYLSRRSENGTWSNRYISLSTDTGAMKFYVEKSGKKTMKSQVNIKKGKLTPLTVEATGKPFAFQLMMEELIGKSDDANLTLAAADETQYNEWVEDITSCFSITDARRRKSALVTAPTDILQPVVEPTVAPTPAEPIVAAPISTNPLLEELKAVHQRKSISEVSAESLTNENPFLKSENPLAPTDDLPPRSAPLERTPSKEEKKDGNSTPKHRYETIEVIVTSDSEDGNSVKKSSKLSSRAASPSPKNEATNTNPELEEKLEKLGKRKSYKPPKKLGNILNSKGLTPEMEEEIKKVKEGPSEEKKIEFEGIAVVEEPPAPKPRQLVISVRPTSPIREGYLFKFDHTPKEELGEDPWIQQFVSLEISTGILQFYAELGGRRIARGKINIIESTVEPIDLVFHGRLYAFKLISGPEKTVSTLAAEDLESFSYWLISFDDCFKYIDDMKEKKLREEEEKKALEMQRMQLAASMARSRSGSELGTSALDRKSSFRTDGSHNMERKTSFRENSEKTLEKKNSMRLDHLEQHISHQPVDDKELLKERLNDSVVTAKVVNHNYFEDPTPLSRPPSFKTKESTFAADDLTPLVKEKEKSRSRSFTTAPGTSVGPIMQLNEKNSIDDLLRFDPDLPPFSRDNSVSNRSRRDSEHEMMEIKGMEFTLKKSTYPADRLARRVKIWYCSGGFSLSTEDEINQFVDALKNTDDPTLKAFSEEKFEHINDWSNLLEVLRKYEQKMLAEMANNDVAIESAASNQNHVKFVYEITIPSRNREEEKVEFEFTDEFDFEALVKKLSEVFGYSELSLFACVPPLLANKESPWCRGLVTVKEDLLFAEDLVLYQEEVIEHMWDSYSALKQMIEQKDEVINQLYNQLSDLQDKVTQSQSVQQTLFSGGFASSSYHSLKSKQSTKELQVIADREFYAADKDGDGRISREEWRNWIQDKHNLVQEHNEVKTVLMNEIKTLRKAMTPQQEQQYNELKKSDDIRIKQEEELVRIHIENDKLKAEVSLLQQRLQEMEEEKNMVESDLQEKIESLQKQLETAINMNHFGGGERNGMSDPSAREISAASNLIDSPYAYNYALDRSTGITAKKKERPSIGATGNGVGDNMDLLALANMNDKFIAQLDGSDFIQTTNRSFNQAQANQTNLKENNNGKPWHLETYPGEMSRLGVDPLPTPPSHLVNVYPQTLALRSPDDEDFYGQVNRPATAQSYLNNLQDNQQNGRNGSRGRDPSRFTFDEANNNNNYNQYGVVPRASNSTTSTSRRPISPSVVHNTLASVYDHPLRNALRQETKPSFASAPSPYTSVRSRVSTTNYNHTINSKMKPTRLKTGTMINDKVVANPAASLGPRNPSPNRVPRGHQNRDDTIYEYSNRLPSSNPQGGDRPNSPSRFMLNTNSWKQKINTPHQPPDMVIRAGNWKQDLSSDHLYQYSDM